jgi:hypothetical protein
MLSYQRRKVVAPNAPCFGEPPASGAGDLLWELLPARIGRFAAGRSAWRVILRARGKGERKFESRHGGTKSEARNNIEVEAPCGEPLGIFEM